MTDSTIRIGMIGCGGNARGHMSRLITLPGVEIVGLCDPSAEALKASAEIGPALAKVPQFTDCNAMLDAVAMDAVEISTPHTQHFDQIMTSLDRGLHVLAEKPMVCRVDHAHEVIAKVKETGLVMGLAYQRHFMAPYRYCREVIAAEELGKVTFVNCLQSQNWFNFCVVNKLWRSKIADSGGGQLNDSGSHLLDILLWMTDLQPQEVFAFIDNLGSEVDIMTAMSAKFANGALGNFSVVGHATHWFEEITIWCEKGTLAIRGNEVWRWEGGEQRRVLDGETLGRSWSPDENFIAAIRGEEEIQATPENGLRTIQLTEAAWRSGETGRPAQVEL
jgi:predicted dehydrogenase